MSDFASPALSADRRPKAADAPGPDPSWTRSRAAAREMMLRHVGPEQRQAVQALSEESDPEIFWNDVLRFALRLRARGRMESAGEILSWTLRNGEAVPDQARKKAQGELEALQGQGNFGARFELLSQRFFDQALDPKLIAPMVLGSTVFQLTRAAALSRLATGAAGWWTRGFGARLGAGLLGFTAEVPTFALGSRLMHSGEAAGLGRDLLTATLGLGALKAFAYLGNQAFLRSQSLLSLEADGLSGIRELGRQAFSQASIFGGMMAANRLEAKLGLRPPLAGPNEVPDILAAMLSQSVGLRGARHLLGPRFAAWQQELEWRLQVPSGDKPQSWSDGMLPDRGLAWAAAASSQRAPMLAKLGGAQAVHMEGSGYDGRTAERELPVPTAPQTAARSLPKFEVLSEEGEESCPNRSRLSDPQGARRILTQASGLSPEDRQRYARFVLDRVPDYPILLRAFAPPASIRDLTEALHWFCKRFGDESESGLKSLLQSSRILPSGADLERPLSYDLLVLMRTAISDAVHYLDGLRVLNGVWAHSGLGAMAARLDPSRFRPEERFTLKDWQEMQLPPGFPELTEEVLRTAYRHMVRERVFTQKIYQHYLKDEFAFAVTDAGHEVQGTAAAFALKHEVNPEAFAISPHYRSGTLVGLWSELQGYDGFYRDYIRQQLSRASDPWSKGRQTASHFNDLERGILPAHSEVGRNLSVAVGYARALQQKGHRDAVVYAEFGDGSMALSDFHEAMTGATVMGHDTRSLPVVIGVLDNQMAISVEPASGRALSDLKSYAKAFGAGFFTCDGNDFIDVYQTYRVAVSTARDQQKPVLIWVQNLPRLNNHSSAAQFQFDFKQRDPLLEMGEAMVEEGLLREDEILRRNPLISSPNFFPNHQLGEIGEAAKRDLDSLWSEVAQEPAPTLEQTQADVRLPYPEAVEAPPEGRPTGVIINGAIRAALRDILEENPLTWVNGQDTGMKGGVMQATAGLWELFPRRVTDAPINEPAIVGIALGFAIHQGAIAFPEIQFGDYSPSALHWMIKAGNLLWTSGGSRQINFNLRLPVEPGIGGAVYHSTPLEGLYAAIPGLTIVAPSTSRDAYGLLRSAAEYAGPVLIFEPKALYRLAVGDAFPSEPRDANDKHPFYLNISLRRGIPDLAKDFRVPLGKAAIRREGKDLTLVTWGLAHYEALQVLDEMVAEGIDVELIDLRTIVPPDMATVLKSVEKTGKLLVAHQDRVFASLGREIQVQVQEAFPYSSLKTKDLGMLPVPGIPQHRPMEKAVMVKGNKILAEALRLTGNSKALSGTYFRGNAANRQSSTGGEGD